MAGSGMIQTRTRDFTTLNDQFQASQDPEVNLENLRPNTNAFRSSKTCDLITHKDTSKKNGNTKQRKTGKGLQRAATFSKPSNIGRLDKGEKENEHTDVKPGDLSILPPITGIVNNLNIGLTKGQTSTGLYHSASPNQHSPSPHTNLKRLGESPSGHDSTLPKNPNFDHIHDPESKRNPKSPSSDVVNDRARSRQHQNSSKHGSEQPANQTAGASSGNVLDKAKTKFEKKVQKSVAESTNRPVPSSVSPNKSTSPTGQPVVSSTMQGRDAKAKSRRSSLMSINKSLDEQFSFRKKIEEFRKWHGEQFPDTTENLPGTNFMRILEEKAKDINNNDNNNPQSAPSHGDRKLMETKTPNGRDKIPVFEKKIENRHKRPDDKIVPVRPTSGATWKTWRDANDSDAYNDVNKYIRDNDLMDAERHQ